MNATTLRTIAAPLLIAGGATATVLGGLATKAEAAKVGAEARAGRTPNLAPTYMTFGLSGVGIAAAGAGLMLATHSAKAGLPSLIHTLGFAGTAVGAGVALVGLAALAIDHGSHGAPHAPHAPGPGVYGVLTPRLL